ncbi:TLC domain-containing protein 1 [Electrophorus electricus]|uniref:TLC domain-containing protein n=1 Tax=Electrophorus electricus TaxID=8005 RepID=A0A4W4EIT5_ELEEL|nr:TLC domain-containing protein 1 [Electrophorus electricus]
MDGWLSEVQRRPALFVLCSSLGFRLLHRLLQNLPRPAVVDSPWKNWKWQNLSVSLVHSLLTGTWAILCMFQYPVIMLDLNSFYTPWSYLLIIISTGYFIQDAGDIILSGYARESWEFLLHHMLVIPPFLYVVLTSHYVGGAVVALFVEVNNIFLHLRQKLKLAGVAKDSLIYSTNKLLNFTTYVSFRLGAQFYITWYIVYNYSWLVHAFYFLVSIMLMNIMILIYFYRLLRADFFKQCNHQNGIQKFAQD